MAGKRFGVLVVDDSAVIRRMICDQIEEAGDMEVVGTAADGRKAVELFKTVKPDVVTLDIKMPVLDGLETLDAMLAWRPTPVIMVSALTQLGGETTLEALERGALDYVPKPNSHAEMSEVLGEELLRKIRNAAGTDVQRILRIRKDRAERRKAEAQLKRAPKVVTQDCPTDLADKCIAIGISTGGPPALAVLFRSLRPPTPPIVVVQHMPPNFTKPLAWRLDSQSALSVKEAANGDVLLPNHALIAPGGTHLRLRRQGNQVKVVLRDGSPVSGHKPSVDVMMTSAAEAFPNKCLGVIMTGMGRDGSDGCRAIREAGGYTLGQDANTSDVYGMNKVAMQEGNIDLQFALDEVAATIRRHITRLGKSAPVAAT
ncbi:MAG: chemotaxis response regulator protein-glutamate methylesterase [Pirellulales bacterium]|nr:chemotaxis response regulator protein-glutamate methylesterase [Pirellulales bacterium]